MPLARSAPILQLSLLATMLAACGASESHEAACKDDACEIPACTDPFRGRAPVQLSDGTVAYAGQAILLAACATGCHDSTASGSARNDAPEEMNFDLRPLPLSKDQTLDASELENLRKRQLYIYQHRDELWREVVAGAMPLKGAGDAAHKRAVGTHATFSTRGECTRGAKLDAIEDPATQQVLRDWLACGSPFVEANGTSIPKTGKWGDQYPSCTQLDELEPTFENVYAELIAVSCVSGCHEPDGAMELVDYSTPERAYNTWLGADGKGRAQACPSNRSPYITPGDPAHSYALAKVGAVDAKICNSPMPIGPMLSDGQLDLLVRWVRAGAPAPR